MKTRSCADCMHAVTGQFVPFGTPPPAQPTPGRQLMDCDRGHWPSVIRCATLYTNPRPYRERAEHCPDFRATVPNGELFHEPNR